MLKGLAVHVHSSGASVLKRRAILQSFAEDSSVAPNRTSVQVGAFSLVVENDKMMEDQSIPSTANANFVPSNNIFMGVNLHEEEKQAIKEHIVQIGQVHGSRNDKYGLCN